MAQGAVEHISERYGYSLQLPDGRWDVVENPSTWHAGFAFDSAGTDSLSKDGRLASPKVRINSQALAEGVTWEDWLADYDATFELHFPCTMSSQEPGEVAGEPARFARYICRGNWLAVEAVLFHDGRAYGIRVDGPIVPQGRDHGELLDEWAARLSFIAADT